MYKAIVEFYDLTDGGRKYSVGDVFPRAGFEVSEERIAFLLGNGNKLGKPVIEKESGRTESVPTKAEVEKMQFFSLKSLATKNGIDPTGKKTADLKAEIIEKLNL